MRPLTAHADEVNLIAASRAWALACATGDAWEDDGIHVVSSGAKMRSFNGAYVTNAEGAKALGRACAYFAERGVPFRARVRDNVVIDAGTLAAAGLRERGGIPSLLLSPIPTGAARAVEIRRVSDGETLRHHVEVIASAFEWQADELAAVFSMRLLDDSAWQGYIGYVDGRPAATSQLYVTEGTAGIYYVATLELHRRRGLGEALTWHAVRSGAAMGCKVATLQASEMGQPIYERMGFRQAGYFRSYYPEEA
jgi:ribosomal protein S18 acetylase RimI-like enzyme